jgi:hypothetical protein
MLDPAYVLDDEESDDRHGSENRVRPRNTPEQCAHNFSIRITSFAFKYIPRKWGAFFALDVFAN